MTSNRLYHIVCALVMAISAVAGAAEPQNTQDHLAPDEQAPTTHAAANWPSFRGPTGNGASSSGLSLPSPIVLAQHTIFDVKVPEEAHSSPIVWDDRVYLTGEGGLIMAFSRTNGKLLWKTQLQGHATVAEPANNEPAPESSFGTASPTPVTDGKAIYAFFGDGLLACVTPDGKQVWAVKLQVNNPRNAYGVAASPLLYRDLLIQEVDRDNDPDAKSSYIVALRTKDGSEAWRQERAVMSSWTSPVLVHGPAGDVLVTTAPPLIIAYDPKTGQELWHAEGTHNEELASSPIPCGDGLVVVASADGLCAFKVGGKGDISQSGLAWSSDADVPAIATLACAGARCLVINGCNLIGIGAADGKTKWKVALDGDFWASPVVASDRIYAINKDGMLYVVSTEGKKLQELDLAKSVTASPALVDGRLYVRTDGHLMCLGKP